MSFLLEHRSAACPEGLWADEVPVNSLPHDTEGRTSTYLQSWLTLLPGLSFLSLWAQNTRLWMPALREGWAQGPPHSCGRPDRDSTGPRCGQGPPGRLRGQSACSMKTGQGTQGQSLGTCGPSLWEERLILCMEPALHRP